MNPKMNFDTIQKTAQLAKLHFAAEESQALGEQLQAIFQLFDSINTEEISALAPLAHPLALRQALRDDVVQQHNMLPSLAENAPDFAADFIKVPRVID